MSVQKPRDKKDVMELVKEYDVKFVRFWFTDILGQLKSFAVPVEELEVAFEEGMGFDGSSIQGFVGIEESDMVAKPDPTTFAILPWRPKEKAVARMFCDIYTPDGSPYEGDPRYVLKRNLEKMKARFVIIDSNQVMFMLLDDEKFHPNYDIGVWINTEFFARALEQMFELAWKEVKVVR